MRCSWRAQEEGGKGPHLFCHFPQSWQVVPVGLPLLLILASPRVLPEENGVPSPVQPGPIFMTPCPLLQWEWWPPSILGFSFV